MAHLNPPRRALVCDDAPCQRERLNFVTRALTRVIVNLVVQLDHLPQFGRLEHLPLPQELCLADVAGDVLHLEELQRGFSGRLDRRTSRVIFAYRRRVEVPIAEESVDGVDVSRVVV